QTSYIGLGCQVKRLPRTPRKALLTSVKASMALFLHCRTEAVTCWASAPSSVRLPPQTLRLTMGTFRACSARSLVAGLVGSIKNWNHSCHIAAYTIGTRRRASETENRRLNTLRRAELWAMCSWERLRTCLQRPGLATHVICGAKHYFTSANTRI